MDDQLRTSLSLLKRRHRERLCTRKFKRRVRMDTCRALLDTAHHDTPITQQNIPIETNVDLLVIDETNGDENLHDDVDDNLDDAAISDDDDPNASNQSAEIYWHEAIDEVDPDAIPINDSSADDPMEYFNLVACWNQPDVILHDSTNVKADEFCGNLLLLLRNAKMCKAHSERLIHLIRTGLPIPNSMPRTMKDLLTQMNGKTQTLCFVFRIFRRRRAWWRDVSAGIRWSNTQKSLSVSLQKDMSFGQQ